MNLNILLTCAGRRHYLAEYFRSELVGIGKLVGADMDATAPALHACDVTYAVPAVADANYLTKIREIIDKEKIGAVFSLNDLELGLFASCRESLEAETGAVFFAAGLTTYNICSDKLKTYHFCRDLGLPYIPTFTNTTDALDALEAGDMSFPLIVKPRWGSGSIAVFRVNTVEELMSAFDACSVAVSNGILAGFGSIEAVLIQELIIGREYGLDILYGRDERLIGFCAKQKISMRSGETDKAMTVSPLPFADIVNVIARELPHRGNLDCDLMERDGVFYLLEFNPRFGGGYPFSHLSGANHVAHVLNDLRNISGPVYQYAEGRTFAKCDILVPVPNVGVESAPS